jgi:enamine deaminase RidA (YjgF/YER057c/UK114 family)
MQMKDRIFSGSPAEDFAGFAKAVIDGPLIHVSGTLGPDPATGSFPDSVEAQLENALASVREALHEGGADLADVKTVRVYITEPGFAKDVAGVLKAHFDAVRPTNTLLVCQLPAPGAKVEIEVSASRRVV